VKCDCGGTFRIANTSICNQCSGIALWGSEIDPYWNLINAYQRSRTIYKDRIVVRLDGTPIPKDSVSSNYTRRKQQQRQSEAKEHLIKEALLLTPKTEIEKCVLPALTGLTEPEVRAAIERMEDKNQIIAETVYAPPKGKRIIIRLPPGGAH
jgi:hypothetical protein